MDGRNVLLEIRAGGLRTCTNGHGFAVIRHSIGHGLEHMRALVLRRIREGNKRIRGGMRG
jgi:hypothetical protein